MSARVRVRERVRARIRIQRQVQGWAHLLRRLLGGNIREVEQLVENSLRGGLLVTFQLRVHLG